MTELYDINTRQLDEYLQDCIEAGLVANIISSPGMGKSSKVAQKARENALELIDHRLSTSQPEDLSGLPEFRDTPDGRRIATFTPFDLFPIQGMPIPQNKQGWLLFFDEFNSAHRDVQAATYKVTLDKKIGQHNLHHAVAMVLAGNHMSDRAITENLSTALQSRVITLHLKLVFRIFLEDVMVKQDWDERIIAYLNFNPDAVMDFRPDHKEKTFCCPRTWEFMNRLIKNKEFKHIKDEQTGLIGFEMNRKTPLYAGTITSGIAASFVQFCSLINEMITIDDVLHDPMGLALPQSAQQQWAIISHLSKRTNDENINHVTQFVARLPGTYQVLFYRSLMVTMPDIRSHPAFRQAMVDLRRYFQED